jgi:hypothetical protein
MEWILWVKRCNMVQHADSQLMADNPSDDDHTMDFYPWNA